MGRFIANNLAGSVYGRLTALHKEKVPDNPKTYWACSCSCGGHAIVRADRLMGGNTKSCGCLRKESLARVRCDSKANETHGKSGTLNYKRWARIKGGCTNARHANWEYYGARGIKLCDRWQTYEGFLADVGEIEKGSSLIRIDKMGDWEPGNVQVIKR